MAKPRSNQTKRPGKYHQLPAPGTMHWGVRRKASVVLGIRDGLITREQACRNYMLSIEELTSWEADFAKYGTPGLLMKTLKGRRLVRPPHAAVGDVGEPSQGGVGTKRAR